MSARMIDRLIENNHGLAAEVVALRENIKAIEQVALARAERIAELEVALEPARSAAITASMEKEARRG